MKTTLLITTMVAAALAYSVAAQASPKSHILPDLGVNQVDQPPLDLLAVNKKALHFKIKGVNVDDEGDGADDDSGSGQDVDHGRESKEAKG